MSTKNQKRQQASPISPVPPGSPVIAPISLDKLVIAYLTSELDKLTVKLQDAIEEKKKAEIGMIAQLNRVMGQHEGGITAIEQQIKTISETINPPTPPIQPIMPEPMTVIDSPTEADLSVEDPDLPMAVG